jgi:hypothetical protein
VIRVDVVAGVGLVVLDVEPTRLEQLPGTPCEVDGHDRVAAAVRDEDARARGGPAGAGRSGPRPSA